MKKEKCEVSRIVNLPGKYPCPFCSEKFRTHYNYNQHIKTHEEPKPRKIPKQGDFVHMKWKNKNVK
jgi:hypothetical protein